MTLDRAGWRAYAGPRTATALVVLGLGCADAPLAPPPPPPSTCSIAPVQRLPPLGTLDLAQPWQGARPSAVGVDDCAIEAAVSAAASIPRFRSLVAVREGRMFLEEYFGDRNQTSLHDVRSVTKSVISNLTGIALDRGLIGNLDDPIGDYTPLSVAPLTPEQAAITFRDLLTMTGGFQWNEAGGLNDYSSWILSGEHIQFLLDRPIVDPPGSRFTYNSAAVHLLGVVLEAAVGEPLPAFAARELFGPLGIDRVAWEPLSGGHVNGGSGVDLVARDLARLGQLYLQDGVTGDTRLLPDGWVAVATAPKFGWRSSYGALDSYTYGFLWWVSDGEPERAYLAWGWGGQFVYVVPELDLVVVATTHWPGLTTEGGPGPLERAVLNVIVNQIHRAAAGR